MRVTETSGKYFRERGFFDREIESWTESFLCECVKTQTHSECYSVLSQHGCWAYSVLSKLHLLTYACDYMFCLIKSSLRMQRRLLQEAHASAVQSKDRRLSGGSQHPLSFSLQEKTNQNPPLTVRGTALIPFVASPKFMKHPHTGIVQMLSGTQNSRVFADTLPSRSVNSR